MPRARNIKHSFFTNDQLAEIEPLGRLLFIGLWTLADYKGDLEWREKRVKANILPYDNCNITKLAINLDKSGFIRFYSDGNKIYVRIINFIKHQNPHKNERAKGSDVPEYSEILRQAIDLKDITINLDKSGLKREYYGTDPADSLFLNDDSLKLIPEETGEKSPNKKSILDDYDFSTWPSIPDESLFNDWIKSKKKAKGSITVRAIKTVGAEVTKAVNMGFSVEQCLTKAEERSWKGFESEWMRTNNEASGQSSSRNQRVTERLKQIAAEDIEANGFTNELD